MGAVRTYGIPKMIETSELFHFNGGAGKLRIQFTGGIPDPKFKIPATYSTSSEFEQLVIENSPLFNTKVFRYAPNGQIISYKEPVFRDATRMSEAELGIPEESKKSKRNERAKGSSSFGIDPSRTYPNVETAGEATEVLLELGVKAEDLGSNDAIVAAMMRERVAFPNLKLV